MEIICHDFILSYLILICPLSEKKKKKNSFLKCQSVPRILTLCIIFFSLQHCPHCITALCKIKDVMVRLKSTENMDVFNTTTRLSKQDFTENKE